MLCRWEKVNLAKALLRGLRPKHAEETPPNNQRLRSTGAGFWLSAEKVPIRPSATVTISAPAAAAAAEPGSQTKLRIITLVTTVPVKDAIEAVAKIVANLALGIRGASLVSLAAAVLVLGGALAAGRRNRVYDAVILKTLGATRARLLGAYGLEYLVLGLATAVFGVAAGSIAASLVVTKLMNLSFIWLPGSAAAAAAGALLVTVALGLIGTFSALSQKPGPVLRTL